MSDDLLRRVRVDDYTLETWDTHRTDNLGKSILGYRLSHSERPWDVVFFGDDFACAPGDAIDSDAALRNLLGFLTLRPGDTDADYFADYTERQKRFCEEDAESMAFYSIEPDEGFELPAFEDVES